jgi:hypothetical protein
VKTLLKTLLKTCVNVVVEAFVKAFVKTQMSTFLKTRALYTREPAGTMQQEALARRELDRRWMMIRAWLKSWLRRLTWLTLA